MQCYITHHLFSLFFQIICILFISPTFWFKFLKCHFILGKHPVWIIKSEICSKEKYQIKIVHFLGFIFKIKIAIVLLSTFKLCFITIVANLWYISNLIYFLFLKLWCITISFQSPLWNILLVSIQDLWNRQLYWRLWVPFFINFFLIHLQLPKFLQFHLQQLAIIHHIHNSQSRHNQRSWSLIF